MLIHWFRRLAAVGSAIYLLLMVEVLLTGDLAAWVHFVGALFVNFRVWNDHFSGKRIPHWLDLLYLWWIVLAIGGAFVFRALSL